MLRGRPRARLSSTSCAHPLSAPLCKINGDDHGSLVCVSKLSRDRRLRVPGCSGSHRSGATRRVCSGGRTAAARAQKKRSRAVPSTTTCALLVGAAGENLLSCAPYCTGLQECALHNHSSLENPCASAQSERTHENQDAIYTGHFRRPSSTILEPTPAQLSSECSRLRIAL